MPKRRQPHPNSVAANLDKLTEEQRETYEKNRREAAEDVASMESWARYVTGKGKDTGLSQDPLVNEGTGSGSKRLSTRRGSIPSGDRTERREDS